MKTLKLKLVCSILVGVIAVAFLPTLMNTVNAPSSAKVLSLDQMCSIWGGCAQCTGSQAAYGCFCVHSGGRYHECSVSATAQWCEDAASGSCEDGNKYTSATGSTYESSTSEAGRKCNGASYCAVINQKGVNYITTNTCYILHSYCL